MDVCTGRRGKSGHTGTLTHLVASLSSDVLPFEAPLSDVTGKHCKSCACQRTRPNN